MIRRRKYKIKKKDEGKKILLEGDGIEYESSQKLYFFIQNF